MATRIYTLAKELNIDNKELVEICPKVGIVGKGSALATLTDDEVDKLKAYLNREKAPAAPKSAASPIHAMAKTTVGEPVRPSAKTTRPKPMVIQTTKASPLKSRVAARVGDGDQDEEAPPEAPRAREAAPSPVERAEPASPPRDEPADVRAPAEEVVVAPSETFETPLPAAPHYAASAELESPAAPVARPAPSEAVGPPAASEAASAPVAGEPAAQAPVAKKTRPPAERRSEEPGAKAASRPAADDTGVPAARPAADTQEGPAETPKKEAGRPELVPTEAVKTAGAKPEGPRPEGPRPEGPKTEPPRVAPRSPLGAFARPRSDEPASPPARSQPSAASEPPAPSAGPAASAPPGAGDGDEGYSRDKAYTPNKGGKIKVLDFKRKGAEPRKKDGEPPKAPPAARPTVRLGKMPELKQPPTPAQPKEPQAQKPDLRLPKEAIVSVKRGNEAPLKRFTDEQLKKKVKGDRKKTSKEKEGEPAAPDAAAKAARPRAGQGEEEGLDARLGAVRSARAKQSKSRGKGRGDEEEGGRSSQPRRQLTRQRHRESTAAPRKDNPVLEVPCTVRDFSAVAGVPAVKVLLTLQKLIGSQLTINSALDQEAVELLVGELGLQIEVKAPESLEDSVLSELNAPDDDPALLETRPPVVTFLGHVDHGKTSLLDAIIGLKVAAGEAGGITQHIRAYQIDRGGRRISFVDTPGHEAFTEMRARGAQVTDIAVLVVAADDGVMPQTEEAISHIKAANVPIVVALNKSDLPSANPQRAMQQLTEHNLLPSEWGGDVEVVKTSALTGAGLDELLDTLLGIAELHEWKANSHRPAAGICLEAQQESDRGVIAKVIVKQGTLRVGDIVVCGAAHGRVKALLDTVKRNRRHDQVGPSTPVNITGLDIAPQAGDSFYVLDDIAKARELAQQREARTRSESLSGITKKVSFAEFQSRLESGTLGVAEDRVVLNLIIRADTRGSIEAIRKELGKLEHPEVQVKILQASVGGITVADITLAHASEAVVVGFNVIPDEAARALAEQRQVEIRSYDIIYKVADDIKAMLEGKLKPEEQTIELGQALVKEVFNISRVGVVAGCHVTVGKIERDCRVRVAREGRVIGDYTLESLKRVKDDAKEVARGMECGIKLNNFNDVKVGDVLQAYKIQEVARTL